MNSQHHHFIKASFAKVAPQSDVFAEMFYSRLFETCPQLMPVFRSDMRRNGKRLVGVLHLLVFSLDRLDSIAPIVVGLAMDNQNHGMRNKHFEFVEQAFLWSLERFLGDEFDSMMYESWKSLYESILHIMQEAEVLELN